MRSFTYTIHIDRTPAQIWAYMMDFGQAARWRNLVRHVEVVTPGPLRVGSKLLITFDVTGKVRKATSEVWALEPARRFGVRNTEENVTGVFEYTLTPDEHRNDGDVYLRRSPSPLDVAAAPVAPARQPHALRGAAVEPQKGGRERLNIQDPSFAAQRGNRIDPGHASRRQESGAGRNRGHGADDREAGCRLERRDTGEVRLQHSRGGHSDRRSGDGAQSNERDRRTQHQSHEPSRRRAEREPHAHLRGSALDRICDQPPERHQHERELSDTSGAADPLRRTLRRAHVVEPRIERRRLLDDDSRID